jgi:predicted small integral membrane protein
MSAAVWTVFAVAGMVGIFAACVIVVVAGIRAYEYAREKRRPKEPA